MERKIINPWTWQDGFGFVQAVEVRGAGGILVCAGQASMDEEGRVGHPGDMAAQTRQCLDNIETVLAGAGMTLRHVVRLNYYTTDVDRLFAEGWEAVKDRLREAGCRPAATLLGVTRLAFPELLIEIEATAVAE